MASDRWVPTIGYELVVHEREYKIMRRGRCHVPKDTPDDEIPLRLMATVVDKDQAIEVLHALRGTLPLPGNG